MLKPRLLLGTVLFLSQPLFAQSDTFTIKGVIKFKESGTIRLSLINESQFNQTTRFVDKFKKKPTEEEIANGQCTFTFKNIPRGVYGINGYQELNENGKLDMGLFGPKEPWGMSFIEKRPFGPPKFKQMCFLLENDTLITIVFK